MRPLRIFYCVSAVSAFNFEFFPDIFQRRHQDACTVYTIIQYPCAVETYIASNTVLWVDACATTLNITNAPTSVTTTLTSTTTLGFTTTSTTTLVLSLQPNSTLLTILNPPGPFATISQPPVTTVVPHITLLNSTSPAINPTSTTVTTMENSPLDPASTMSPDPFTPTSQPPQSLETSGVPHITIPNLSTPTINPASITVTSIESPPPASVMSATSATDCAPSSTVYPDPLKVLANTTYIIQVTSPEIVAQLGGVPVYLTREGGINYGAGIGVQVFFQDGILFALDNQFGVGWYGTNMVSGESAFALEQYGTPSQDIARDFTTVPTTPMELAWNNCQFGDPSVVWALNVVDGLVHSWFSGVPEPAGVVEVVTMLLVPYPTTVAPPASTSAIIPASPTSSTVPSPTCSPPSTGGYAPGNSIPANTTYMLQLYWSPSPGSYAPYGGNVYLKRDGSYTAANSVNGAVEAFFVDGTFVAADPVFIYGWYTTIDSMSDTPFALGEYLPQAGLTARQFSMAPTSPPTLVWENCGFYGGAAEFQLDQDNGLVYTLFDNVPLATTNYIPIYLVPTINL